MASAVPGPPDLISDMVQPVDLVNSVQRPGVVNMDNNHVEPVQQPGPGVMPVDMLGDLPSPHQDEVSPDVADDRLDARWFSRGTATNGVAAGNKIKVNYVVSL